MASALPTPDHPRTVLHVDMDAFFASVAQLDDPSLRGKPIVVGGHSLRRGVVSSCSYEARAFGVRNAMPLSRALALCPALTVVSVSMARYREENRRLREIWSRYSPLVEVASFDEAYLDLTGAEALLGPPLEVARAMQAEIFAVTRLPCTVGVGPNKLLAKVASKRGKPNGLCLVTAEEALAWLAPLPVRELPGLGPKTAERLAARGIQHISDLQAISLEDLVRVLGPGGDRLGSLARGLDDRPIEPGSPAKSIGAETTFDSDVVDPERLKAVFYDLVQEVAYRARKAKVVARTVSVKLRYANFETLERERTLPQATDDDGVLASAALALWRQHAQPGRALRLVGVRVSHLETAMQLSWLAPPDAGARRDLNTALDGLRERYGLFVVGRGTHLEQQARPRARESGRPQPAPAGWTDSEDY